MKLACTLATAIVALSVDASAANPRPDFIVYECARGGTNVVHTSQYQPMEGTPLNILLEGWGCRAYAQDKDVLPRILCLANGTSNVSALTAKRGEVVEIWIGYGDGPNEKNYRIDIDWTKP